ncbi:MAG: ribosome biogenesis GTPase Der [Phycisphaerales bacterium]|nr:ribosome biogenesis GTPase Der [Phycisphaerales bacterium]
MLPRLAIVGRPNVGKSSLMNMIASRRVSIVDPTPGVTRDRVMAIVDLEGEDPSAPRLKAEFIDTGGYGVYTAEGRQIDNAGKDLSALTDDIEKQIARAIESADVILFVIDAQAGVTAQDEVVAKLLREGGMGQESHGAPAKVTMVANKVDGPRWEMHALEASGLGFGEPLLVSAKNNYRRREFVETLYERVSLLLHERNKTSARTRTRGRKRSSEVEQTAPPEMMLAIVGKRNAGKSTLVNKLAGEERVIVSEIAGTTRDAIDVRFEIEGRSFVAIDTAGLRKKKSFQDRVEWYALDRMQLAIERCDVAMLLIDATDPISQVDEHVAHAIAQSFKPCVIVVNKWDLAQGRVMSGGRGRKAKRGAKVTPEAYEEYIRAELRGLWYAPISFISAESGLNVKDTINLSFELMEQSRDRTTTGKLNRLVRKILTRQGPANKLGTFAKVLYAAQVSTSPPTIVCVVNRPELFTANYQRFLLNRFREELPFPEVPIKLLIRGRKKDEDLDKNVEDRLKQEVESGEIRMFNTDDSPSLTPDRFTAEEIEAMFEGGAVDETDIDDGDDEGAEDGPAVGGGKPRAKPSGKAAGPALSRRAKKQPQPRRKGARADPTRKPKERGGPKRVRRRTSPGRG